jgi:hypothetical protein
MSERHKITAVHERNLEEVLKGLGLLDSVKDGNVVCKFCGKRITLDNLNCIYPKDDDIIFCCDDLSCFQKALEDARGVRMQ